MKLGKKIIAAVLAAVTALTTLTATAFAADVSENSPVGEYTTVEIFADYYDANGSKTAKPAVPTNLKASKKTASTIKVTWKKASGASSYDLRYKESGSSKWTKITKIKSTAKTIKNLNPSTKYIFQVRARNSDNVVSAWCKSVAFKTKSETTASSASSIDPSKVKDSPISDFKIECSQDEEYYIITSYIGSDETVKLPSRVNGLPVDAIAFSAFSSNPSVKTVIIPESVTFISCDVFADCKNLKSILILGTKVQFLEDAFSDCSATVTYNGKDYTSANFSELYS